MELDELKTAWRTLDQRLERGNEINLQLFRDRRLDKARSSLRPLFWGQIAQMLFGLVFIALAALLWSDKPDVINVIVAGVTVQAYGVACILMAGLVLGGMRRIDYSSPVLDIQKQVAGIRRTYILSGMIAGLPWWFLWLPILMVLAALAGVNLYGHAPALIWSGLGVAAAGLIATRWLLRWSRNPKRPRLAQAVDDALTGASLRRAQAQMEELRRFEQE